MGHKRAGATENGKLSKKSKVIRVPVPEEEDNDLMEVEYDSDDAKIDVDELGTVVSKTNIIWLLDVSY